MLGTDKNEFGRNNVYNNYNKKPYENELHNLHFLTQKYTNYINNTFSELQKILENKKKDILQTINNKYEIQKQHLINKIKNITPKNPQLKTENFSKFQPQINTSNFKNQLNDLTKLIWIENNSNNNQKNENNNKKNINGYIIYIYIYL